MLEDASADEELGARQSVQALELKAVLGVPLGAGQPFGVLLAERGAAEGPFDPSALDRAEDFARQAAFIVQNALALHRYQTGFEELERLQRLAVPAIAATRLDDLLAPLAAEALALTGAERLMLLKGPSLACEAAYGPQGPLPAAQDASGTIVRWVWEHGEPLHLLDAQSDEAFQTQRSVVALGLRTVYAVPVEHQGRRHGVLYLDTPRLSEPNAQAVHTLARMAGLVGAFLSRER
jgi:GAF domain-containing protein